MIWKPSPSHGGRVGLAAIAGILVLDILSLFLFRQVPISIWSFVLALVFALSVPALGLLTYWLYGFYTLSYELDRDALTIHWGVTQRVVPLASIREVKAGTDFGGVQPVRWLRWPGYVVGSGELPGLGETQFYSTQALDGDVILAMSEGGVALSPADHNSFLADLEAHRKLDPAPDLAAELRRPPLLQLSAWDDRVAQAWLAAAVVVNLTLFAYVALRFPDLPDLLPIHFDPFGAPDRIGYRTELFRLPMIGLIVLAANNTIALLLHRRERVATYLLLAAALVVQVLMLVAINSIIGVH